MKSVLKWTFYLGLGCVVATGCGSRGDRPELGLVDGTVTMNGNPLPNAQVSFEPSVGRASYGRTNESGKYTLQYVHGTNGAKIGAHIVRVSTQTMVTDPSTGAEKLQPEKIPPQYNRDSVLTAEVHEGKNDIVFDLKGVTP